MIYGSGLRISEATNIRVTDIDSKEMRIFVRNGKGERERYTVLPEASLEMLRKCYKKYKPQHPEGYMFLNREGKPLKPERLRVFFRRYRRKAKISEEFIVHSLRHSFATKLVEEGVPLVQVKELLGHSCIRSTMTYVHVANNMQKVNSPLDIFLGKGEEK
jgi:site-specific recombinase XerD